MKNLSVLISIICLFMACERQAVEENSSVNNQETSAVEPAHWWSDANIYEVNIRQYSPEGTIAAFQTHLPRLKEMGVEILWLMPIFPISEEKRKGTLGSYYAVSDFTMVNPEFGTMEEMQALINEIHALDMRVILDWVPNHTGWDHTWITEHPDYYTKDEEGNIIDPINPETGEPWGWTDVADLNYDNQDMRNAMIEDMLYWVKEAGVDGFRCDVAGEVPDDFWATATEALRAANQEIFMLAEAEHPPHRNNGWFNMNYGWSFHHLMNEIAKGEKNALDIDTWLKEENSKYDKGLYMQFLTNHDENSWNGTIKERLGAGADAFAVLAFTFNGMPLIYSGQEAGLDKRLLFFEKDSIDWGTYEKQALYTTLLKLKKENPALWNAEEGGSAKKIRTEVDDQVYAFYRERGDNRVVVFVNLSDAAQSITVNNPKIAGSYSNIFANSTTELTEQMNIQLGAWEYMVLQR